jgi:hypothetical protein
MVMRRSIRQSLLPGRTGVFRARATPPLHTRQSGLRLFSAHEAQRLGAEFRVVVPACLVTWMLTLACSQHDVPLGSWGRTTGGSLGGGKQGSAGGNAGSEMGGAPSASGGTSGAGGAGVAGASGRGGTSGAAGMGGVGGSGGTPNLGCDDVGNPGGRNARGGQIGITLTQSDWRWPQPVDSMEWEMRVENEPKSDGYLFAYEFGFTGEAIGFVGMQVNGRYQAEPPNGPSETADMVQFWVSNAPIDGDVGDVPYPSRPFREVGTFPTVGTQSDNWMTVNVRYPLESCKTYAFRVGKTPDVSTEGIWYGAWIRDLETNQEYLLGRILVAEEWEGLDDSSNAWSNRLGYGTFNSCDDPEPASVFVGTPTANGGTVRPIALESTYPTPRCPTSRFTEFSNGVRQEIGLAP